MKNEMFEVWQRDRTGERYLLLVTSDGVAAEEACDKSEGDWIEHHTWVQVPP